MLLPFDDCNFMPLPIIHLFLEFTTIPITEIEEYTFSNGRNYFHYLVKQEGVTP